VTFYPLAGSHSVGLTHQGQLLLLLPTFDMNIEHSVERLRRGRLPTYSAYHVLAGHGRQGAWWWSFEGLVHLVLQVAQLVEITCKCGLGAAGPLVWSGSSGTSSVRIVASSTAPSPQ
jgi:hypothetical protein